MCNCWQVCGIGPRPSPECRKSLPANDPQVAWHAVHRSTSSWGSWMWAPGPMSRSVGPAERRTGQPMEFASTFASISSRWDFIRSRCSRSVWRRSAISRLALLRAFSDSALTSFRLGASLAQQALGLHACRRRHLLGLGALASSRHARPRLARGDRPRRSRRPCRPRRSRRLIRRLARRLAGSASDAPSGPRPGSASGPATGPASGPSGARSGPWLGRVATLRHHFLVRTHWSPRGLPRASHHVGSEVRAP